VPVTPPAPVWPPWPVVPPRLLLATQWLWLQVCDDVQAVPQAPQLPLSDAVSTQELPHMVFGESQVCELSGCAQLAARTAHPNAVTRADRDHDDEERLRPFIFNSLCGAHRTIAGSVCAPLGQGRG
jgi:hypothetical protein